jgi:tRNA (guanosine-2'-O-)-methyltransferase
VSGNSDPKPISPRRLQRMAAVLARRQQGLSVVLEDVHDPHNVSAVLRSCDATGVADVHLIYSQDEPPQLSRGVAAGTLRWLSVTFHDDLSDCYDALRAGGKRIYATTLAGPTLDLYDANLTEPCALVFGNESRGLSEQAIELADARVRIPMMGMAESLNISVACAVTLFEAMRQRKLAGMFDTPSTDIGEMRRTLSQWLDRDDRDPDLAFQATFDPTAFPLVWPRTQPMPQTTDGETSS